MQFVKLLSVLLCVLSLLNIAASQDCPSSGIACYPADCCGQFRQCIGSTFFPVQNTAPGTLCKAGTTVWPSDCANTPCPSSPSGGQQPAATPAPTKAAPPVAATTRPITAAPTTRAPTAAPATPVPTASPTQAVTAPPATVAPATVAPATPAPTARPTQAPATPAPTARPTQAATAAPTTRPTQAPATPAPTAAPTAKPTVPIVITPTQAPSNSGCKLSDIFTYADYQTLFPYANGGAINGVTNQHAIFNYSYLISAAANFPNFACSGSVAQRKQEVAAFLAHTSQESSGWWAGQPYNWGYYFSTEVGCTDASCQMYCDPSNTQYPCAPGKGYFGRGPIQLSWNYNYGQVSELLYGDKNVLLNNPDKLFDTAGTAFMTALWFWMTPQYPKPSCHDVMTGGFTPSASDAAIGRLPGFGLTINIVNGGIECGHTSPQQVINRIGYYTTYINYFFGAGNSAMVGANVDCASMRAY